MAILDEIFYALAREIRNEFTVDEIKNIYVDTPIQGMTKPCIFLHRIDFKHVPRVRNHAIWQYMIDMRCHPNDTTTDVQSWAIGIGERLMSAATNLTVGNLTLKAKEISQVVEDNVLHVIVKYTLPVRKIENEVADMETLEYGVYIK